jgi:hypothetical protein
MMAFPFGEHLAHTKHHRTGNSVRQAGTTREIFGTYARSEFLKIPDRRDAASHFAIDRTSQVGYAIP